MALSGFLFLKVLTISQNVFYTPQIQVHQKYAVSLPDYYCFHILVEWPPIGKIAAHSACDMFLWYKYLIVSVVFSHLGFWNGNLFLIAPSPDLCLRVPFYKKRNNLVFYT